MCTFFTVCLVLLFGWSATSPGLSVVYLSIEKPIHQTVCYASNCIWKICAWIPFGSFLSPIQRNFQIVFSKQNMSYLPPYITLNKCRQELCWFLYSPNSYRSAAGSEWISPCLIRFIAPCILIRWKCWHKGCQKSRQLQVVRSRMHLIRGTNVESSEND